MRESRNRAAVSPSPREAASGWVLEAVFPTGGQATIAGFGTESEANEWLGSARHVAWLRATRQAFFMRTVVAAYECVFALAPTCIAGLARCLGRSASAARSWPVCWRSIVYRCLFAATAALLMVTAVVAILAAAVAPLGRSERPAGLGAAPPHMSDARPLVHAPSVEGAKVCDPIALLLDRVSSSERTMEPPIECR